MEVIIREKTYEYISDFNKGWKFSAGDHFKFPVKIGRNNCFVKRFDKSKPEHISGWGLLKSVRANYEVGLPRLHDIVDTLENEKRIYYIFYECLEGQTLDSAIGKGPWINLEKLAEQVFQALGSIHKYQHWFADFCEKNIFCTPAGSYFLIDLDSAQPASAAPENDMYADKEYWALAFNYIVHEAGYKKFKPGDISGILLNYLQAVFLLLRVKIGLVDGKMEYKSEDLFERLPRLLQQWAPELKNIFKILMDRATQVPEESDIKRIKELALEKIVRRAADYSFEEDADRDGSAEQVELKKPAIHRFEADKSVLKGGGTFRLSWQAEHADHIELYRYKVLLKKLDKGTAGIDLNETYDGQQKNVRYSLSAYSDHGHAKSEPVEITVTEGGGKEQVEAPIKKEKIEPAVINISEKPIAVKREEEKPIRDPVINRKRQPIIIAWKVVLLTAGVLAVAAVLAFWLINSFAAKPALYGFQPKKMGGPGEVILYGEHFPANKNTIRVLFDTIPGLITAATDEKLVVQMPSLGDKNLKATVRLVVKGSAFQARDPLSYEPSVLPVVQRDTQPFDPPVVTHHPPGPIHTPNANNPRGPIITSHPNPVSTDIPKVKVDRPSKVNQDLDTADIPPVDNAHAMLEAKLKSESLKIVSEPYRITLGVFGRRRKLVFYNQSSLLLNWVKLAIDEEVGGGSEIRILRNVKPNAIIVLMDNLDKKSTIKGVVRNIHLDK